MNIDYQEEKIDEPENKTYQNVIVYKKDQINILKILQSLDKTILNEYIIKYHIVQNINQDDDEKKIKEDSKLKVFIEERDINGIILNRDKQVPLIKLSMKSPKKPSYGILESLLTMREGDESWFQITNNEVTEENEKKEIIKFYKIKIIEVQEPQQIRNFSSIQSRLDQFEIFRQEGKNYFDKAMYQQAIKRYQKGINFREAWPKKYETDPLVIEKKEYYYLLFCSNIAQCYINIQEYNKAITILEDIIPQCRKQLGQEFEIKNYYRIVACYIKIQEEDRAQRYINDLRHICNLNEDQKKVFEWLEQEAKPKKKIKL